MQQTEYSGFALRIPLQSVYHRSHLLVRNSTVGIPHGAEGRHRSFHFGPGAGVDGSVNIHILRHGSSPPLKVKASVRIFGVDGVPERFDSYIRKSTHQSQPVLTARQILTPDGSDDGSAQDVIVGVPVLAQIANRLTGNVFFRFGEHVELRILVEFEVFEHGHFGFDVGYGWRFSERGRKCVECVGASAERACCRQGASE
mmetsp:Transcript_17685/g.31976  ORF Transcript_17685/g.31976 Transcript_17685/m.31976 type:complete len:200 (-) Transcript_17685:151-750(-)